MNKLLKESVREHIEDIQLSKEQLQTLNDMQLNSGHNEVSNHQSWYKMMGVAATVLLTVGLFFSGIITPTKSLVSELASEVVQNHLHRKPLEVTTSQLDNIRGYFTRLDFVPVASSILNNKGLTLMGGRYCSLQGVTAAQLRFKSVDNAGVNTLYQVGYDAEVFRSVPNLDKGEEPVTAYSKGIKVTLWVERDVLFALTEDPE